MAKITIDTDEILKTLKGYLPEETDAKLAEAKDHIVDLAKKAQEKGVETYEQLIKLFDTDGDGKISDTEFAAKAKTIAEKYHIDVEKLREICSKFKVTK